MKTNDKAIPNEDEFKRQPKLRDWMRGIYASPDNPIRDGMYVETIVRMGRLNPGKFYRLTNGKGKFWMYPAHATIFLPPNDGGVRCE